jgi:FixJ family two-component response regulator
MLQTQPDPAEGVLALVDDDAALRDALRFAFETHGFPVSAFADAETALAADDSATWRCMVLDYQLPGLSGLELLDRLRAAGVRAPAVLITTQPSLSTRALALLAGVEIVEKPLLDDALMSKISRYWASAN